MFQVFLFRFGERSSDHPRSYLRSGPAMLRGRAFIGAFLRNPRSRLFPRNAIVLMPFRANYTNYAHLRPCFVNGSDRILRPVAAKIALHSAGTTGGSAGSPIPVGDEDVNRKCTSTGGA